MSDAVFTGSAVAIVTPFSEAGVDYGKLEELVEYHVAGKTDAIVACGTTGEASTLSHEEHVAVVKCVVDAVAGRVPVIAGAGSNDTRYAVELSEDLQNVGASALLSVAPYYNKTSQRALVAHFTAIARSVTLPIILYNVPARTVLNMNADTIREIAELPNVVGVKECNLSQVGAIVTMCGEDFAVYSGDDAIILPVLSLGGKGVISTMANIIPEDTHDMVARFLAGDVAGARAIQLKAMNLISALFVDVNPMPLKKAMNLMGMEVGTCRLPLVDVSDADAEVLARAMRDYGLIPA